MPEIDTKNNEWVEGNYEEKVPTRTDLQVFLNWYESTIRLYKGYVKDLRVINATEGGAKIEGTEVMTLKDAIEENCRKDVDIEKCLEHNLWLIPFNYRAYGVQTGLTQQFQMITERANPLCTQFDLLQGLFPGHIQYRKILPGQIPADL